MTLNILPPAKTIFFDDNGNPLASGMVFMYVPNTTTLKTTWQDSAGTIPNANPVILDAAGEAIIFGSGAYRQIVQDALGNTIWDAVTIDPGYALANSFSGTSLTSVSIGMGTRSFVTQTGLQFFPGQYLIIASSADASNSLFGTITSYDTTTGALVINSLSTSGSGTYADWNISVSGAQGPSGTVSDITINTSHGFSGTSSGGFIPAITLATTVTGVVKGDGTSLLPATSGTDYAPGTSSLATGIVKSTNTTGALSIAVAADFPTLNQNTTGTAATVTTNANLTGPITSVGNATSITNSSITEDKLSLSNITTANVTTARHGFVPILPNDATKYFDGTGAYSAPPITLTLGSSTTSLAIGTGTKVYTTQAGLAIAAGQFLVTPSSANATDYMFGQVTSYVGTTLTLNVTATGGSGTHADWNIVASGPQGAAGAGSGTVNSGTANQLTYYGATGTTVSGNSNATITNGDVVLGSSGVQGSVSYAGSTSGTTVVKATAIASTTTLTLPAATDTLVGKATTDTLTNKTLTSPVIATIVNSGTLTLPTSTDTLVGKATTDTLTNKTLTSPVIATIVNSGTLTLPTTTTTLVGRNTTDTLTNKTIVAANNTISGITEAMQSLSDVTTANVTTSAHGYAPKAPNDATLYLDGTGAYSSPSSGGLVYLSTQTASSSATINFTSLITSTYDDYMVIFDGVIPATSGASLFLRTSSNNGSSYDAGASNYAWGQSGTLGSGSGASEIDLGIGGAPTNNAAVGIAGSMKLYNLNNITVYKRISWDISYGAATGAAQFLSYHGGGARIAATAVNAIRFLMQSGNIASGTFKLYGIKKT